MLVEVHDGGFDFFLGCDSTFVHCCLALDYSAETHWSIRGTRSFIQKKSRVSDMITHLYFFRSLIRLTEIQNGCF